MPDSPLSFASSSSFRDALMVKNLPPYSVEGEFSPPSGPINYETVLGNSNVIDSPNNLNETYPNQLYPLNEYGPDGGYNLTIDFNGPPLPVTPNQGPYEPLESQVLQLGGFYIQNPYIINIYSPEGGYDYVYDVTDIQVTGQIHLPYFNSFVSSSYSPYSILISNNPTGSDGSLSQDSYIAKLGASQLQFLFQERINTEIAQSTVGAVNLQSLQDPFEAALLVTGQQPLIYRNWKITVPENAIVAAVDFATRIAGAYWPVSFIPGDYFTENEYGNLATNQTSNALSTVNQLTGGLLGPILNLKRNPSQIFLANTGNGQRSALFLNLHYNRYSPDYNNEFGGGLGVIQGLVNAVSNLINPNGTINGGYYVGSSNAEPSQITSPVNQIPINQYGEQNPSPVYGPSELGQLYEGNIEGIKFGLAGKSSTDGGGIDGQFVWVSPKYKDNAGFKATPGGGPGSADDEFNIISSQYKSNESTNLDLKKGSILDNTQKLVDSGDLVTGANRLKHVGNAINQVSKVFNDGYKEMTKGSQVVSYKDNTTGAEAGIEYCRVFTKDTPYYTFADLQKTDGITTSGRRFTNSVLDNTYNLNIAPLKNPGSTNIVKNEKGDFYAKKYMFSIENLAWRTSSRPGFTYDELPDCEKGPNGGRVMWFPPYNLSFNDSSTANWNPTTFLGRPEPIYTYKDTTRSGSLSWTIIVDSPSVLNVIVNEQLKNVDDERINSILESFFAGCVKFDIYELAKKYNKIPFTELQQIQETLNNPKLTAEELAQLKNQIPADNTKTDGEQGNNEGSGSQTKTTNDTTADDFKNKFKEFAFYFDNDIPGPPKTGTNTTSVNYDTTYSAYIAKKSQYAEKSKTAFLPGSIETNTDGFFTTVIESNYQEIAGEKDGFIVKAIELLEKGYGPIKVTLEGSASAVASNEYNKSLSQRRIDSVRNFFKTKTIGGKSLGTYMKGNPDDKFIIESAKGFGEDVVIPKTSTATDATGGDSPTGSTESGTANDVNCRDLQKSQVQGVPNSVAQIYSTSAMACRRVAIKTIDVKSPPPVNDVTPEEPNVVENPNGVLNPPLRPLPTTSVTTKLKEGLSKKVLRALLSECDYFEMIKENEPMVYKTFKDKIKHFNPAFHSMTPEGLNARLTFLNQCVRPGETIPTIDADGRPKYNDAINTSFGAPPVLILRIGDFYNTKIIPGSLSFQYEPLQFDLNPEGIGVQPMLVKVSLQFNIIGGMGLAKPVEQLQNALSFNYYANTEIYDERAVWTEDTSALDKEVFDAIKSSQDIPPPKITNQQSNEGGKSIGDIKTTILGNPSGETGELVYQQVMDSLLETAKTYFVSTTSQLEKIVRQQNNGVLQLINNYDTNRQYTKGKIGSINGEIYGKPQYEKVINYIFDKCISKFEPNGQDIFYQRLTENGYPDSGENSANLTILKQNIKQYLENLKPTFSSDVAVIINDLVSAENELIYAVSRLNVVYNQFDGKFLGSKIFLYQTSGSTKAGDAVTPGFNDTYLEFKNDYDKLPKALNDYIVLLKEQSIITVNATDINTFEFSKITEYNTDEAYKTFFLVMSRIFNDPVKFQEFRTFVLTTNIISSSTGDKLVKKFDKICDDLKNDYKKELDKEQENFTKFKNTSDYKKYDNKITETLYTKGKPRKFDYTTSVDPTKKTEWENTIKNIYGTVNYGDKANDVSTFEGKINI
jgi:hypothetical protein